MKHDGLSFANAIVLPEGGQRASVVTAVCKRCDDGRSSLPPVDGEGRIELTGACSGTGAREPFADIRSAVTGGLPGRPCDPHLRRTDQPSVANEGWT